MICFTLAVVCGCTILQYFSTLAAIPLLICSIFLSIIIYSLKPNFFTRFCLGFLIGLSWSTYWSQCYLDQRIDASLEQVLITVEGQIISRPDDRGEGVKFKFLVEHTFTKKFGSLTGKHILLAWYGKQPNFVFRKGDRWQVTIKLKRPHGLANPGGFDYERYLFLENIHATGYILPNKPVGKLQDAQHLNIFDKIRDSLAQKIEHHLIGRVGVGFIQALTLGYREHVSPEMWKVLQQTGTAHLMAISGLHVGLVSSFIYFLGIWLAKRVVKPNPQLNPVQLASIFAILAAIIYSCLAGFSLPTYRAVTMITILMLLNISQQRVNGWYLLASTTLLILIGDPFAGFKASFWLSFGAVAWIYYLLQYKQARQPAWKFMLQMQGVLSIGLLPLTLLWFQQASIIAPLANLIAVPWVSFVVVPLAFISIVLLNITPPLGYWLLGAASQTSEWLYQGLGYLVLLPHSYIEIPHLSSVHYLFLLAACVVLLLPRGFPSRYVGLMMLLPCFFSVDKELQGGEFQFTLLDVGQGLAAIIRTAHGVLVFDTGIKFSATSDSSISVLLPYLKAQRIANINMLIISHNDTDHLGGAATLINNLPVEKIYSSQKLPFRVKNRLPCKAGISWEWDQIKFEFLHPYNNFSEKNRNNASCVLKISSGNSAVLLTGDIEKSAEQQLIRRYGEKLASTILVVPHHGSKTSSSSAFIEQVSPEYALYPLGYLNRFNFPHAKVTAIYNKHNITTLSTAEHGAITFLIGTVAPTLQPILYRKNHRRFWFSS